MSSSQGTERPGKDGERGPRAVPPGTEAPGMANEPGTANPSAGVWSMDGRLFFPLGMPQGLNDTGDTAGRLLQGWQDVLDSQRMMLDAMRDLVRRQQDMMLAASRAMLEAATHPERATAPNLTAPLERCAAQYGAAWRRGLDQAWASTRAVMEASATPPVAANEPGMPHRPARTG